MSQPPSTPGGDDSSGGSSSGDERPRPSYGHPGPAPTDETRPLHPPAYGQPAYGQPGQPPYGQPSPSQGSSWPQQHEYGQDLGRHEQTHGQPTWSQQSGEQYSQQYAQPPYGQPSAAQYGQDLGRHEQAYAQMYGEKPRTGMAIASLVLGILAILTWWAPVGSYASFVMALLAIIFGVVGVRRTSGRGMAIAGLIMGGLALVLSVILSILWTNFFVDAVRIAQECVDENPSLGPAYEQCITDRTDEVIPFQ